MSESTQRPELSAFNSLGIVMEMLAEENNSMSVRRRGRPAKSSEESLREWHVGVRLSAREWEGIADRLRGMVGARARGEKSSTRNFVEGVLWVAQTGACWQYLPKAYGSTHSVYVRFSRWAKEGCWQPVLDALPDGDSRRGDLRDLVESHLASAYRKRIYGAIQEQFMSERKIIAFQVRNE